MPKNINFKVEQDQDPESPREWDNLGIMICSHRRYELGDEQFDPGDFDSWEDLKKHLYEDRKAGIVLPLGLYDHSGITMYIGDIHDKWDGGQVGFIYIPQDRLEKEYGIIGCDELDKAREALEAEVKIYDQYLRGDVWSVLVEDENGELIDSLSGLYGEEAVEEYKKEFN